MRCTSPIESACSSSPVVVRFFAEQAERKLRLALDSVDRHLQGEKIKPPKGLELFTHEDEKK